MLNKKLKRMPKTLLRTSYTLFRALTTVFNVKSSFIFYNTRKGVNPACYISFQK